MRFAQSFWDKNMNVTIVGGGNIGTQFAAHCAEKGHNVIMYSSKPQLFSKTLTVVDENREVLHTGQISCATNDPCVAFCDADIIFVTLPAYCMQDIAKLILPNMKKGVRIGLVPGTGGGECAFKECMDAGATIFGLQRVPSVARLVEYGKTVCATGYRDTLFVASLPGEYCKEIQEQIADIFDKECKGLPNYLNLTLTPSNPILHTTRLRTIFEDYSEGTTYESLPLFYEEWSNKSSELLFLCDDEVQRICRALSDFDLTYVKSLKEHYESNTPEALTAKIQSIKGFKGLTTPSVRVDGKYIPDLNSRYFTADFSYGLVILKQIADFCGVDVPNINETLAWYDNISLHKDEFSFGDFGICDRKTFEEFYKR
ncbi:MAG: hypothetical protein E7667_04435 [Ruminococcaceae bacterium]|nr:hypothetical protein [Oscillospiraceae bacterium]